MTLNQALTITQKLPKDAPFLVTQAEHDAAFEQVKQMFDNSEAMNPRNTGLGIAGHRWEVASPESVAAQRAGCKLTKAEVIQYIEGWQDCHVSEFCCNDEERSDANRELKEVLAWIEQNTR